MPAVALPLRLVELSRSLDGQSCLVPRDDPARQRDDVLDAVLAQRLRRAQRAVPVGAVEDERAPAVRLELLPELGHRNVLGAGDPARLELPVLADVDEDRRVVALEPLVCPSRVDLEDKLPVTRHAPRIIGAG